MKQRTDTRSNDDEKCCEIGVVRDSQEPRTANPRARSSGFTVKTGIRAGAPDPTGGDDGEGAGTTH